MPKISKQKTLVLLSTSILIASNISSTLAMTIGEDTQKDNISEALKESSTPDLTGDIEK